MITDGFVKLKFLHKLDFKKERVQLHLLLLVNGARLLAKAPEISIDKVLIFDQLVV